MSDNKEGNGYNLGMEVKVKDTHADGKCELKLTPSKVKFENTHNLEQLNGVNQRGSVLGRIEHKIGDNRPDLTGGITYAVPRLNEDVGIWTEGNVTYKNCEKWMGDISALLSVRDQFFVGSKIVGNLQTKKSEEITGVVGALFNKNFLYLHANCLNHNIRFGFSTTDIPHLTKFAAEAELDLDKKGPIEDRMKSTVAFNYILNADSRLKFKFDITKKVYGHFSFIHKINNNLQLTFTDYCNPAGFFKNSAQEKYRLGLAFEASF